MSYQQQRTKVDIYGKSLAKEHEQEQKRQLEAYQRTLNAQLPVNNKLVYEAQAYDNQAAWNYQTGNTSHATSRYGQGNDYYAAGPSAATVNYDQSNDYYRDEVDNQFAADNVYHTSFDFASEQYQSTANSAAARTHQQDDATDQLVDIAMGKKMKKEKKKEKKKAANRL